ncbi:MAG: tRNA threonylcarbamoyladenosine dehydratase [Planctomycetaceae bacterium]|nr:tRNA threonylcarbamoyladenosine dehydratase [Planctomycetaceae bacterium]
MTFSLTSNEAEWQNRTRILLGEEAVARLARARIYVFGLGAVGGYAVEGLARSGVGMLRLVDFDVFKESNLNRQVLALRSTLGRIKAEVAAERVRDINPAATAEAIRAFAHDDTLDDLLSGNPDLVIDAVDSLNPKVAIIARTADNGIPVLSALGAATRRDAGAVAFDRLFAASGCPLGRLVRKRLRRRGIADGDLWCVYSREERDCTAVREPEADPGDEGHLYNQGRARRVLGSLSTITGIFGLRLAHEAILRLAAEPLEG